MGFVEDKTKWEKEQRKEKMWGDAIREHYKDEDSPMGKLVRAITGGCSEEEARKHLMENFKELPKEVQDKFIMEAGKKALGLE